VAIKSARVNNALWSRESLLLGNNVLLMAAMLTVLLRCAAGA
jgi:cytochrome c-type biogenesis protein CcmF